MHNANPKDPMFEVNSDADVPFLTLVQMRGPSCAAWLVNRFRQALRLQRSIALKIECDKQEPLWFRLAVACLLERELFVVKQFPRQRFRVYVIEWHGREVRNECNEAWSVMRYGASN